MPLTVLHHPSPKRKRDHAPPIPLLNTALRPVITPRQGSPAPASRAESPRNAVADQLQNMNLIPDAAIPMSPLSPMDDVIHKKPKLEEMIAGNETLRDSLLPSKKSVTWDAEQKLDPHVLISKIEALKDVSNTPRPSRPRIFTDIASFAQPTAFVSSTLDKPTQPLTSADSKSRTYARSASPRKSVSPPPPSLTWKGDEVTGHLVDPVIDSDDDGTGLNGIGFRPTPALAYARSQKRKQQLYEWRARETREARAKRRERRQRGVGGRASRNVTTERDMPFPLEAAETTKRTVKFAV